MASIFKRKRKVTQANGKTVVKQSLCWYIEYRDSNDQTRRVRGYRDKIATQQKAAQLEREAEQTDAGLLDRCREQTKRPLTEHLEDFRKRLKRGFKPKLKDGCSDVHVRVVCNRVKRVTDGCGFRFWKDIDLGIVHDFLSQLDVSEMTYNYYVRDFQQFLNWMVKGKRAHVLPPGDLPTLRVEQEQIRRALTPEEVMRLLRVTASCRKRFGMTGHQRSVLYLVAIETGFRLSELKSLTVSSFDFAVGTVTVEKEHTKNRIRAVQPLKDKRSKQLQAYFAGKQPTDPAFDMWKYPRGADMLRLDLDAAEIPCVDESGLIIDFHALRNTFITALDRTDATLAERMTLARHSRAGNLTLGTYTHVQAYNLRRVVEQLPDYSWPGTECVEALATGTDDARLSIDSEWTGKWTGKRTGMACSDRKSVSVNGIDSKHPKAIRAATAGERKAFEIAGLGAEKKPLSSSGNGLESNGPGRIRTYDQWIMSPLL